MSVKKYLVVEGIFDKAFYDALLPAIGIRNVDVKTPNDSGIAYNGKGNAIDLFATILLSLQSDSAAKLAIIVDADFTDIHSQGFRSTLNNLLEKSKSKGFNLKTKPGNYQNGILLKSDKCKNDAAVWIMPDNKKDGYLEYLLFDALDAVKNDITSEAISIISKMKHSEYPAHHEMKAKLAVAMAMLENPGRNISHLIGKNIIKYDDNQYLKNLKTFLCNYFN